MAKSRTVPHVHSEYDPPVDPGIDCSVEPSMTQQCFQGECDINNILSRFQNTGLLPEDMMGDGRYMDVASAVDYHTAQNIINSAHEVFNELPLKVRRRFNGDPLAFLEFIDNPDNRDEARELGLLKPSEGSPAARPPETGATGAPSPVASATA